MKQFLSLLFLTFFCTCVGAQNETSGTEYPDGALTGSGSLLVEFGVGNWTLEKIFYQPEPCAREARPQKFSKFQPVRRTWLRDFEVGGQRIELNEIQQPLMY